LFFIYFHKTQLVHQLFQNEGKNKTSTANNSSLPRSIPKLKLNLEKLGKSLKFPLGPITSPNPGPTFDIAEADPDIEVIKSKPFIDNNAAKIKKIIK
tara:strand:+ start:3602 stop:3892 length:291 start_codon:yes stop_codon:yes gene_type:complete